MDDINKIFSGKVAFNVKVSDKCICWSGPKAQTLTSNEIVKEQNQTPLKSTPCGGFSPGKLRQKSKNVVQRGLEVELMEGLLKERIGTHKIESQAMTMKREAKKDGAIEVVPKCKNWGQIRANRDP